eukprot:ANDGO_08215.mRNA.1 LanC-like protein GCR2
MFAKPRVVVSKKSRPRFQSDEYDDDYVDVNDLFGRRRSQKIRAAHLHAPQHLIPRDGFHEFYPNPFPHFDVWEPSSAEHSVEEDYCASSVMNPEAKSEIGAYLGLILDTITSEYPPIKSMHIGGLESVSQSAASSKNGLKEEALEDDAFSVFGGYAGCAYLFWRISRKALRGTTEHTRLLKQAYAYILSALPYARKSIDLNSSRTVCSFMYGEVGTYALAAAVAADMRLFDDSAAYARVVTSFYPQVIDDAYPYSDVLYGRAGYLHALLFVNRFARNADDASIRVSDHGSSANYGAGDCDSGAAEGTATATASEDSWSWIAQPAVLELASQIIVRGRFNALSMPLIWPWLGDMVFGAGHGVAGILNTLMNVPGFIVDEGEIRLWPVNKSQAADSSVAAAFAQATVPKGIEIAGGGNARSPLQKQEKTASPFRDAGRKGKPSAEHIVRSDGAKLIKSSIDYMLEKQYMTGNFPAILGQDETQDVFVQWTHGASGFISLLLTAYRTYQEPKYLLAAQSAAECVWFRGLSRENVGLTSGIAGNGYCFLQMYRVTGNPKYLYWALSFGRFACSEDSQGDLWKNSSRRFSLGDGLAGLGCFLSDLLDFEHASFPGYELDELWAASLSDLDCHPDPPSQRSLVARGIMPAS